jgi:hypothetical protein
MSNKRNVVMYLETSLVAPRKTTTLTRTRQSQNATQKNRQRKGLLEFHIPCHRGMISLTLDKIKLLRVLTSWL